MFEQQQEQHYIQPCEFYQPLPELDKQANPKLIRKFINSAIYVEKPISVMPPVRKTSPLSLNEDEFNSKSTYRISECSSATLVSRKSAAFLSRKPSDSSGYGNSAHSSNYSGSEKSSNNSEEEEHISTVRKSENTSLESIEKAKSFNQKFDSELKLSLGSMLSNRTYNTDAIDRDENFRAWLTRKNAEKLKQQQELDRIARDQETQRQEQIHKEKENFKRWLAEKRALELNRQKQKDLEEKQLELKEAEKEKKKVECELSFQLWLRRKKKEDLERRIHENIQLLTVYEEKKKRLEENELAYQKWLQSSKYKQKPIPSNKGLESLRTSASITYINPIPWQANLPEDYKPNSK